MKENNPYTLTFGIEPSEMIQRFDDTEAIISCKSRISVSVYKKIWEAMSPRDKDVILAFTEECMKVSDLCEATGMTSSSFSKYRERLMLKGIIISPKHGYVELALPRFKEVVEKYEKY